jgi:hypothetical protein
VLLVAPKWMAAIDPRHPGWVMGGGLDNLALAQAPLRAAVGKIDLDSQAGTTAATLHGVGELTDLGALPLGPIRSLRAVSAPDATPLLDDGAGHGVLIRTAPGVLVLSDPDLLDNLGLADARTAGAAVALLDALDGGNGPIVFDVSLDGLGRPRSLLGLALAPPFLGATLCLLAAAVLMGAHAAVRFGPAQAEGRALALGKAALLDNTAMLIGLARREPAMGRRYAALDRLAPHARPPFATLAGEAERARDVAALMRAVRALHQRQTEILGERS